MKEQFYNRIIWAGLAVILVVSPAGVGTIRAWSGLLVLPIAVLVFLWLYRLNNNSQPTIQGPRFQKTALDKPIGLFALLAAVSLVFSINRHDSFYALLRLLGYAGVYYVVVNNYSRGMRRRLIGVVICTGTVVSIYGLLQYFGFLSHPWWRHKYFLSATFLNHNHFAGYLELIIPVTCAILIGRKNRKLLPRAAAAGALIVMIAAFIFAQSRGAWFCLLTALVLMNAILVKRKALPRRSMFILIILVALIFSYAYIKDDSVSKRMYTFAEIGRGEEASFNTRVKIWRGTISMIRENPLTGTGINTFVKAFPRHKPGEIYYKLRTHFAHNDYLHMASEMGVAAPLIMFWLLITVIRRALAKKDLHPVILGCSIGMFSLALHGLVDFNFHIPANMLLFTVYAAFVIGETGLKEKSC